MYSFIVTQHILEFQLCIKTLERNGDVQFLPSWNLGVGNGGLKTLIHGPIQHTAVFASEVCIETQTCPYTHVSFVTAFLK